jgi:hypothetical protein
MQIEAATEQKFFGYTMIEAGDILEAHRAANEPTEDKPKWGPWIGWNGGDNPVECNENVEVIFLDMAAGMEPQHHMDGAEELMWRHSDMHSNIIAYRIRKEAVRGEAVMDIVDFGSVWNVTHAHTVSVQRSDAAATRAIIPTLDGTPIPGIYTNEAGDVIVMEAIGDG